ncbi:uncharacterized protein LOC132295215 isoform X3 [Cornus florida]|uniref:uncharacterized protein LOC132295215 isoform X3 n=1 Tax=Cornus florida TaxID=4283 RepID=UPI00289E8D6E|nr:uncharacterized protein LOC132295215 isoform X3 [Cornus florida]
MAAICCYVPPSPTLQCRRAVHGFRCCSVAPNNHKKKERPSPHLLKFAVSGVTELLRFLSSPKHRSDAVSYEQRDDISVSAVDDVLMILKSDYENAYFVTGIFTSAIYTEDCIFEDPTIKFRGSEIRARWRKKRFGELSEREVFGFLHLHTLMPLFIYMTRGNKEKTNIPLRGKLIP